MPTDMEAARSQIEKMLRGAKVTRGLTVRTHGQSLVLGRPDTAPDGSPETDDRVKLTRVANSWGLSVKRHTGRWEQTPFSGTLREMVEVIGEFMQHLVAP